MINRRLGKAGRNITFRGSYNYTNSSSEQFSVSETDYYQKTEEERLEILNRYISTPTLNYNYSARFTYSEPIFKGGFCSSAIISSTSVQRVITPLLQCRMTGR